jgi:hypothetical protein
VWTGDTHAEVFMDPERDRRPADDEVVDVGHYAPMKDALLISRPLDAFEDLLVPRADEQEWEVWQFAKEGAAA